MEQNAQLLRTKNEKLEKLCRALQAERNQLRKQEKPVRPVESTSLIIQMPQHFLSLSLLTQQEEAVSRDEHRVDKAEDPVGDGVEKLTAVNDDDGSNKEESQSSPLPASEKASCEGEDNKNEDKEEH